MFPYNRMKKEKKRQTKNKTDKKKVNYNCECCNYNTPKKTDYFRHLNTKKHLKQISKETKTKIQWVRRESSRAHVRRG